MVRVLFQYSDWAWQLKMLRVIVPMVTTVPFTSALSDECLVVLCDV